MVHPRAFEITQDGLEIRLVVTNSRVLSRPGFEILPHLLNLVDDGGLGKYGRRNSRKFDILARVVLLRIVDRLSKTIIVVASPELNTVQNSGELTHSN